jgi:hypothetical protein
MRNEYHQRVGKFHVKPLRIRVPTRATLADVARAMSRAKSIWRRESFLNIIRSDFGLRIGCYYISYLVTGPGILEYSTSFGSQSSTLLPSMSMMWMNLP